MNLQTQIKLDKFKPRWYQQTIFDAFENKGYKNIIVVWPRGAGKDIAVFNLIVRAALMKPEVIYYVFPEYSQGKKAIVETLTNDGMRILDYIPEELLEKKNEHEMIFRFKKTGSILQVIGSNRYDKLRGSNCTLAVFSEYAWQDPRCYSLVIKPRLNVNDGRSIFISTPYGSNHFHALFESAKHWPQWYVDFKTVDDTQHVPIEKIEEDIAEARISRDMALQEYWCSFSAGVEGAYYSKYLTNMRLNNQITQVPWEESFPVYTAWDLGHLDKTCIIFFQKIGVQVRIIDYYEKNREGLPHYCKVVLSKPYTYAKHFGPHDIRVHDLSLGLTRWEVARQLGITFSVAPQVEVEDGIETVRATLPKMWIDEEKCRPLIKALESYRQEWDPKREKYKGVPLHDWASDAADAMRYLCLSLPRTGMGTSPEELDRRYNEAMGFDSRMPAVFRDEVKGY